MVFEILGETLLELLAGVLTDVALRSAGAVASESKPVGPALALAGYLLLGTSARAISVLLFPPRLALVPRVHGVRLDFSPVILWPDQVAGRTPARRNEQRYHRKLRADAWIPMRSWLGTDSFLLRNLALLAQKKAVARDQSRATVGMP